jgi:steroid delta-isomerase
VADAGNRAAEVMIRLCETKAVEQGDRPRAHGDDVAQDPADAGRGPLEGLDRRGMVVRLDLEGDRLAVTEIDHARVLTGALQNAFSLGRKPFQEESRMFVAAVLGPEQGEDGKLEVVGVAAEQLADAVELLVGQPQRAVERLFRSELRQGEESTGGRRQAPLVSRPVSAPLVISVRRARLDDLDFLVELVNHEDVQPFLGGRSARDHDAVAAEIERSREDPTSYGRFVIEVDGARAGVMGFEVENRRSRIAHLERLAVHPDYRGQRVADDAARLFQRHLIRDLGYHRLQLEIYGFNERAQRHAERVGFLHEGVRRRAYRRHGAWADGALFALVRDDLDVPAAVGLLHDYVMVHNECVRTGDWQPLAEWFTEDAQLAFEGVPVGPFEGRQAIVAAYDAQPPDDEVVIFGTEESGDEVIARYGWLREPGKQAGRMLVTPRDGKIEKLIVTFEDDQAPA